MRLSAKQSLVTLIENRQLHIGFRESAAAGVAAHEAAVPDRLQLSPDPYQKNPRVPFR